MKKILFVCDGEHFSETVFNAAIYLNQKGPILLTGIFLPSIDYSSLISYAYEWDNTSVAPFDNFYQSEEDTMNSMTKKFSDLCAWNKIKYTFHKKTLFTTLEELAEETRFADMALISSELFFASMNEYQPNKELKRILHDAECPILLIPGKFHPPENIIIAYDGSASSMAAIKEFTQSFDFLSKLPVTIVHFDHLETSELQGQSIREYLSCHYSHFSMESIAVEDGIDLSTWAAKFPFPIIVAGAYGRSGVSLFFRESFIANTLEKQTFPIFLFHAGKKVNE